jgi:DTW domain-containing protein YfiP
MLTLHMPSQGLAQMTTVCTACAMHTHRCWCRLSPLADARLQALLLHHHLQVDLQETRRLGDTQKHKQSHM